MSKPEPSRVEIALFRTTRALKRAFNVRLADIGLNMTEGALLSFVDDNGAMTQRELADVLHVSRVSTGTIIDGLESRSLVRRTADPADRRVWLITLTDQGAQLVKSFRAVDAGLREDLRAGFNRAERHLLADLLQRLEENAVMAALPDNDDDHETRGATSTSRASMSGDRAAQHSRVPPT